MHDKLSFLGADLLKKHYLQLLKEQMTVSLKTIQKLALLQILAEKMSVLIGRNQHKMFITTLEDYRHGQ